MLEIDFSNRDKQKSGVVDFHSRTKSNCLDHNQYYIPQTGIVKTEVSGDIIFCGRAHDSNVDAARN